MSDRPIEIQLASEEAMRRNAKAIVQRFNSINKEWQEAKKEIQQFKNLIHMQNQTIQQLQTQISLIQATLYNNGTPTNLQS